MRELCTIALLNIPKMTKKIAKEIINLSRFNLNNFDDFKEMIYMSKSFIKGMPEISDETIKYSFNKAYEILRNSQNKNIIAISQNNEFFPKKLLYIPNAPLIIYVKGNLKCLNSKYSAAVIGTRHPSIQGEISAKRLGYEFVQRGIIVVSGLAVGCDKNAHEGAIEGKGHTIAVLGNGLDSIYPKQNIKLAEKILEMEGCLISEYPIGEEVKRSHLIERDRLQSGLSNGVVVVETGISGGTMHTVNFAIKQGKLLSVLKYPNTFYQDKLICYKENNLEKAEGNKKLVLEQRCMEIYDDKSLEVFILNLLRNNDELSDQSLQVSFF